MQASPSETEITTLARFTAAQDWALRLAQDRRRPLLFWITRGQGRLMLDGMRRGISAHNAVFVPAGRLFALDLGRQSIGHVVQLATGPELTLPAQPAHLRILEGAAQGELTGLVDAASRELQADRPLARDAMRGHAMLLSVWLRRQMLTQAGAIAPANAAERLSQRFALAVAERYGSGQPMAAYAAELGVTPTHLTRAVKSATGKTAADILTERIVFETRRLLAETDQPAKDIARTLGFGSAAYFTRFVQHHTGKTPRQLRGSRPA